MKRWIAVLMVLAMVMALAGCTEASREEYADVVVKTEQFLAAMMDGDMDGACAAVDSSISRAEVENLCVQLAQMLDGVEDYTLKPVGYHFQNTNGQIVRQVQCQMTAGDRSFVVTALKADGQEGLQGFYVAPVEQTNQTYTGTPGTMKGADALQWIVLILGVAALAVEIWMIVDCARRPLRRKVWWLLAILLGSLLLTMEMGGSSAGIRFNVGLHLRLSALIRYGDGSVQWSQLIPVGTLVYFIMRKKLALRPKEAPPAEPEI